MMDRTFACFFLAVCLLGCVDLGVESRNDQHSTRSTEEEVSYRVKDYGSIDLRLVQTGENRGDFSIVCLGEYEMVRKQINERVRFGRQDLTIGMFPGLYWASETLNGPDYASWPLEALKVLLANGFTAGVPTLLSLVYEPFDSYHDEKCGVLSMLAGYGLIGCCKRCQWKPWEKPYSETSVSVEEVSPLALSGYTVEIMGLPYSCKQGEESVSVTVPDDRDTVKVFIRHVPSLNGELGGYVSSLTDEEFPVDIQRKPDNGLR